MLNMINFLVFRVTRGVVFALETCLSTTDEAKVSYIRDRSLYMI